VDKEETKEMRNYTVANILDLLEVVGEDEVKCELLDFSCSKNREIDEFIHKSAIEFAKRKMSITYLVFDEEGQISAYFTLAHKPSTVSNIFLSNTGRKKLKMYARYDDSIQAFSVSAFLIAQFGKNDVTSDFENISGNQLMDCAVSILKNVQKQVGGGVVFWSVKIMINYCPFIKMNITNLKFMGKDFRILIMQNIYSY
jgi:hypothetical protein